MVEVLASEETIGGNDLPRFTKRLLVATRKNGWSIAVTEFTSAPRTYQPLISSVSPSSAGSRIDL